MGSQAEAGPPSGMVSPGLPSSGLRAADRAGDGPLCTAASRNAASGLHGATRDVGEVRLHETPQGLFRQHQLLDLLFHDDLQRRGRTKSPASGCRDRTRMLFVCKLIVNAVVCRCYLLWIKESRRTAREI